MAVSISPGSIRKRQKSNGQWEWQALLSISEDGKRRQKTKYTGIACTPLTDAEKGSGRRVAPSGKGAREAQRFLATWRQEIVSQYERQEEAESAHAMSTKLVPEYMDYYWSTRTLARTTIDGYRSLRKHLDHPLLAKAIGKLTSDDIQAWMSDERANEVSENTLRKASDQLRYALDHAVDMGHITKNPCTPIEKPKRSSRGANPLSKDALASILPDIEAARDGDDSSRMMSEAATIALQTGMREGEIAALRWGDIDGGTTGKIKKGGKIHVNGVIEDAKGGSFWREGTKNGEKRVIPMGDAIARTLMSIWRAQSALYGKKLPAGNFVISEVGRADEHVRVSRICKEWGKFTKYKNVVGEQGLKPFFHDLRDTFATQALQMGVPLLVVSGLLGHDTVTTTARYYAKWIPDQSEDAIQDVGDMLDNL
ncbi:MAG: site-specific integrase [Atopobiaceae bacterium]|nr:site-specific integrase [Atopobiaceae bacterium]